MSSDRGLQLRSGDRRSGVNNKASTFARAARSLAVALALASAILLGFDSGTQLFADYADGYRTEPASTLPDAVKVWRQDAWRLDDYFAQIRLGDLYSQNQSFAPKESSKNPSFYDPVEAYVWYFMALRPDHSYSFDDSSSAYQNIYTIRSAALTNAEGVFYALTFEQRLDARARILYILSSRGAEGFITLGRLHGVGIAPQQEGQTMPSTPQVLLCMRSDYSYWPLSWYWYLRASVTGEDYPHPPVWKWVENSPKNWNLRYSESDCQASIPPPPPTDNLSASPSASYPSNYSAGGPVPLNSTGSGASNGLPVSPPNSGIGSDPRVSLQGGAPMSGGNSDPIALTPQDQSGGMAATTSSGYPGGGSYAGSYGGGSGYGGGSSYGNGYGGSYARPLASVFVANEAEALTYFHRAELLGHPMADSYTVALRYSINTYNTDGKKIIADAEKRARYWSPPYEFYPGATAGGMPHSDENLPGLEQRIALGRVGEMPWSAIAEALDFRRYAKHGRACGPPPVCYRKPIVQFQSALGYEPTGFLTPPQVVRLIQMAAVDGDAVAQDRLGIMYAKGIGVPQNFVRAEKWFINAANQHNADALFNLYVLYKVAPNGIDQDEHKAASYNIQAMTFGYNRLLCELQDLLRQADDRHDHADGARR
jgi:TPR repeat protein